MNIRKKALVFALVFSVVLLALFSSGCYTGKATIKEWLDTEKGKDYVEELKKSVPDENVPEFNFYAEANHVVVAEYVCKPGVTMDAEKINSVVEEMKFEYQRSILEFMDENDVEEYYILIRYKSSDGKIMGERLITRSN